MGKSEELHTYSHVLPGLAEAAERMEDAIGCQIGCQEDDGAAPEGKQAADSSEKVMPPNVRSWNQIAAWLRQLDRLGWFVGGTLSANGLDVRARVECRRSGVTSLR